MKKNDPSTLLAENTESLQVGNNVPTENEMALIATPSLDNRNALDFYQSPPGAVLTLEVCMMPNPPVSTACDLESISPVEIYQTFAPGQAVPAALTAAQHRLDARVARENETVAKTNVEPIANRDDVAMNHDANQDDGTNDDDAIRKPKGPSGCDFRQFSATFCQTGSYTWQRCHKGLRGLYRIQSCDLRHAKVAVCADKVGTNIFFYTEEDRRSSSKVLIAKRGQYRTWHHEAMTPGGFRVDIIAKGDNAAASFHLFVGLR